jgi:hypothetical protein
MHRKYLWVVCSTLLGMSGCNQGPEIVPVSGQVTIEGKPLAGGFITILPNVNGKGRAAQGAITPDGKFAVTTRLNGREIPGTYKGEHQVEISAFVYKDRKKVWFAPTMYSSYHSSKLIAKIDGPTDQLQFDLKWDTETNRAKGMVVENIQAE